MKIDNMKSEIKKWNFEIKNCEDIPVLLKNFKNTLDKR